MLSTGTKHFKATRSLSGLLKARRSSYGFVAPYQIRTTTTTTDSGNDVRKRLTTELRTAMKSKNTFASTVLRSVLAEVYTADKNPSGPVSNSQVMSILRKAIARRSESAVQFASASRPELAKTEKREAEYLENFLPPSMSESDIDALLSKIATEKNLTAPETDAKRRVGILLKLFFGQVDKALVDSQVVKQRAQALLDSYQKN